MRRTTLIMATTSLVLAGCQITPQQLSGNELSSLAVAQKQEINDTQVPVTRPITIYEAMARALKSNLDHKVAMLESALARGNTRVASLAGLPSLTLNAGYNGRNNYSGSFSRPILSSATAGSRSGTATTSDALGKVTGDLTLSWNVLDFGLSYIRAQQEGDKQLIAAEKERSVANRLIEEVRSAYWRAISADYLRERFKLLGAQTRAALDRSRKQRQAGLIAPVAGLTYERELLDIEKQIHDLTADLMVAKAELARLMNLKPGTNFSLVQPKRHHRYPRIQASLDQMTEVALNNRPELREVIYRGRVNAREAKANLLELLPSAQLYLGANADSNDLLYNSNWIGFGAKAAWNAMRVFQYPARKRVQETQTEIIKTQALATSMAIMTQVHVGRIRYDMLRKELHAANHYYDVQRQLLTQIERQVLADSAGEQTLIRERMNTLVARVKRDVVYADFQNALASIFWSMGLDPYDLNTSDSLSLEELTASLENIWANNRMPSDREIRDGQQVAKVN